MRAQRSGLCNYLMEQHYPFYPVSHMLFYSFQEEFAKYREITRYFFRVPLVLEALQKFH